MPGQSWVHCLPGVGERRDSTTASPTGVRPWRVACALGQRHSSSSYSCPQGPWYPLHGRRGGLCPHWTASDAPIMGPDPSSSQIILARCRQRGGRCPSSGQMPLQGRRRRDAEEVREESWEGGGGRGQRSEPLWEPFCVPGQPHPRPRALRPCCTSWTCIGSSWWLE